MWREHLHSCSHHRYWGKNYGPNPESLQSQNLVLLSSFLQEQYFWQLLHVGHEVHKWEPWSSEYDFEHLVEVSEIIVNKDSEEVVSVSIHCGWIQHNVRSLPAPHTLICLSYLCFCSSRSSASVICSFIATQKRKVWMLYGRFVTEQTWDSRTDW